MFETTAVFGGETVPIIGAQPTTFAARVYKPLGPALTVINCTLATPCWDRPSVPCTRSWPPNNPIFVLGFFSRSERVRAKGPSELFISHPHVAIVSSPFNTRLLEALR